MINLYQGDCLDVLRTFPPNSIEALITDPPAGISFMNKAWDDDKGGRDQWIAWLRDVMAECLRVMKPGAHGLVWAIPRTSHWTGSALEQAGFEVRDVITHLFGTGFPKSLNIEKAGAGKDWSGWGTALKPACEFWFLIRKPLAKGHTVAANVLQFGTGGLNIDAGRIEITDKVDFNSAQSFDNMGYGGAKTTLARPHYTPQGRFPANLVLDETSAEMLDTSTIVSDSAEKGVSRFFYVAKASKSDKGSDNTHPTVKSTKLMEYLIKLITPPNGIVLDPFMGSGSTGVACKALGVEFVGIEKELEYFEIAKKRTA